MTAVHKRWRFIFNRRAKPLAKGTWRLQLLSDSPLLPWEDPDNSKRKGTRVGDGEVSASRAVDREKGLDSMTTAVACQERAVYGGVYVPNKYLLFFRYCARFSILNSFL